MNLTNCKIDVDARADDGQFIPSPDVSAIKALWIARNGEGIHIRFDCGITLAVTVILTNAAANDIVTALLRNLGPKDTSQSGGTD